VFSVRSMPRCKTRKSGECLIELAQKSRYDCSSCKSRVAIAEPRGQFGNPDERGRPPLEAVTRAFVKTMTDDSGVCVCVCVCVTVICIV
jgi:hypothetical protein